MCMLTESVQLCTCISALYRMTFALRLKGLQPQQANNPFFYLFFLPLFHIESPFTNQWLTHKRTSTKMKCVYMACLSNLISCLCLRHRCCAIEYLLLFYLNVNIVSVGFFFFFYVCNYIVFYSFFSEKGVTFYTMSFCRLSPLPPSVFS